MYAVQAVSSELFLRTLFITLMHLLLSFQQLITRQNLHWFAPPPLLHSQFGGIGMRIQQLENIEDLLFDCAKKRSTRSYQLFGAFFEPNKCSNMCSHYLACHVCVCAINASCVNPCPCVCVCQHASCCCVLFVSFHFTFKFQFFENSAVAHNSGHSSYSPDWQIFRIFYFNGTKSRERR